jgi:hypothetical protein
MGESLLASYSYRHCQCKGVSRPQRSDSRHEDAVLLAPQHPGTQYNAVLPMHHGDTWLPCDLATGAGWTARALATAPPSRTRS